jgi:outer membrane protein TolC
MTVFDGGRRHAASDQALAAHDFEVAFYRQSVLTGFQQVEDSLAAVRILEHEANVQDRRCWPPNVHSTFQPLATRVASPAIWK